MATYLSTTAHHVVHVLVTFILYYCILYMCLLFTYMYSMLVLVLVSVSVRMSVGYNECQVSVLVVGCGLVVSGGVVGC